jgi:hypothetical protein
MSQNSSVVDPGCLSRILDPTFFHPGSELFPSRIPDPILSFYPSRIPDPGVRHQIPNPDPQHCKIVEINVFRTIFA